MRKHSPDSYVSGMSSIPKLERGREKHFPLATKEPIDSRSVNVSLLASALAITPHEIR